MGIWGNVKKGFKAYGDDFKKMQEKSAKRRKENRAYKQDVNQAVTKARREAFKIEAQKQARIRAKLDAQRKFNPTPQQRSGGLGIPQSLLDPVGYASRSSIKTKEKVIKTIAKNRSPKKKKKKSPQRTRTVVKYVEKPKPKDAVADLLSRLPQ